MKLIGLTWGAICCEVIKVSILYEKIEHKDKSLVNRTIVEQYIEKYNENMRKGNLEVRLDKFWGYDEYSKIPELQNLGLYAGTSSIMDRLHSVEAIPMNIIMLISINEPTDIKKYNEKIKKEQTGSCHFRYILDMNSDANMRNDIPSNSVAAFREWLSLAIDEDITNADDLNGVLPKLDEIHSKIRKCKYFYDDEDDEDQEEWVQPEGYKDRDERPKAIGGPQPPRTGSQQTKISKEMNLGIPKITRSYGAENMPGAKAHYLKRFPTRLRPFRRAGEPSLKSTKT